MFASTTSVALVGVEPRPVRVEVHITTGKEGVVLVGLPDTAVREARERVFAACLSTGYVLPKRKLVVNLAPADLPKAGSAYDLPIALGALASTRLVDPGATRVVALGELALDGAVRPVRGGLAAALVARSLDLPCLLPPESAAEASLVEGARVHAIHSLAEAISVALGETPGGPIPEPVDVTDPAPDLAAVRGQATARRALEIAAAGGHHLLFTGPPGAGKTMLARCLPGVLPDLDHAAALEVAQAWAAAGYGRTAPRRPPFRAPHHSATLPALIGGGSGIPVPGEATLAHNGVLFMDELGEFPAVLLDGLRQPLEEGVVRVVRKGAAVSFPCSFQLVGATNPCPCGFLGDVRRSCSCSPRAVDRYRRRLSGPLLDRFDVRVTVTRVEADELLGPGGEGSDTVRRRVLAARELQSARGCLNRRLGRAALDDLAFARGGLGLLRSAVTTLGLTGRGWDRVRRVARTIADLAGSEVVGEEHVAEALAFRGEGG